MSFIKKSIFGTFRDPCDRVRLSCLALPHLKVGTLANLLILTPHSGAHPHWFAICKCRVYTVDYLSVELT